MTVPYFALLHTSASLSWTSFSVHPSTVIGLLALSALYAWRARVERARGAPPLGRARPILFGAAVVTMFLSLNGWLHDLSDSYLFSAHMLQHLLLAFAVAPLMVMGTPGWMLRPALRYRAVASIGRALTRPKVCFATFNVVMAGWHLPVLYNAAMAMHPLHIVMHLTMLAAAVMMWWPVLSPLPELPRLAYPMQMLYLFLMTIPMSIIAVCIVYSGNVLYPAYASAPRVIALSPLQDQLIGGLIMWVPGGLYFFTVISVIFFRWQQADGVETQVGAQARA